MSAPESNPGASLPEKYLGRRLRPWWGLRPGTLAVRGLIQAVLLGALTIWLLRVAAESIDTGDLDATLSDDQIKTAAMIAAVAAGIGALVGVLRLIVGVIDMISRRTVEGMVVSSRERYPGDWMPGWARTALRFRRRFRHRHHHDVGHRGRSRYEIVIDTGSARQSWNVEQRRFDPRLAGRRARITVTPLVGYVRGIEVMDAPSATRASAGSAGAVTAAPGLADHGASGADWDDPEHDVLKQVPGYENHGRRDPIQAGLDRFRAVPGLGGLLDRVPNLDEAVQKAQEQIRRQSGEDGSRRPGPDGDDRPPPNDF